jgi:hypothetical protein
VDLAARDDRDRLVEQPGQLAEDPALRLAAQSEQNEIVTRQDRVDDLRYDRLFEPDDSREHRLPGTQPGNQVLADFSLHGPAPNAHADHGAQFRQCRGKSQGHRASYHPVSSFQLPASASR